MNKKILPISLAVLVCLGAFGCTNRNGAQNEAKNVVLYQDGMTYSESKVRDEAPVYALTYEFLGGNDVMPIGGFYVPYASGGSIDGNDKPDLLTDYYFNALKEAGINTFFYSVDRWVSGAANTALNKALDLCEKYGIGYYVDAYYVNGQLGSRTDNVVNLDKMTMQTEQGKKEFETVIDEITKNGTRKCVLGILGQDEPFPKQLPYLEVLRETFYSLSNTQGLDIYSNAIGFWQGDNIFWGYSDPIAFDDYIQEYFDTVKPKMLSVTQYPYTSANTPESTLTSVLFNKLSVYRKLAQDNGVPHWRMLQAGGQWNDTAEWIESVDPYPSEGELLFDVNVSLAYGAKGIQYFPLVQPYYFSYEKGGTYDFNRNGLIGADGNLTQWYYYAKRANEQIQAIDEYLMNASNDGIIVHGEQATKAIITDGTPGEEIVSAGTYEELTKVVGDDCVIGCFNYKGKTALYVVNYSRTEKANVALSFDKNDYRYTVIQRAVSAEVVGGRIPLTLDAGEGALIVLA